MTPEQTTLIENVRFWGVAKGLTGTNGKATIQAQYRKFYEESHELLVALKNNDRKEIRDALGDMQVVAILARDILGHESKINPSYLPDYRHYPERELELLHAAATADLMSDPSYSFLCVRAMAVSLGHDPDECLQEAYDVIKLRTGVMKDGQFIKDIAPIEEVKP